MYNSSKWFSFFHNNFKMKVNKMPPKTQKKSTRGHQGLWTQLSTPRNGQKRSVANKESQRCNGRNAQSDSRHKDFKSRLLDLLVRAQPALEDEGQWKEKNEASFSRTMETVLHLEPGYTCEKMCVYMPKLFFLLNINYVCWFQKGNTPNWSCLFF